MSYYHLRVIAWINLIILYIAIGIGVYSGAIHLDGDGLIFTATVVTLYLVRWGKEG